MNETRLTVRASANENATKPIFHFDWGDGTETRESFSDTGNHMYHSIGNYTLHVQAWSLCNTSTVTAKANISVPTPVHLLKNLSLQSEATVFGEATQFRLFVGQGSDFECFWSLGDHVNVTTSHGDSSTIVRNHTYLSPGHYRVWVTCRNRRSELTVSNIVPVQTLIKGLRIYPIPPILFGTEFQIRWKIESGTAVVYKAYFSAVPLKVVAKAENDLHGQALVTIQEYKTPGEFLVHVTASNAVTNWISTWTKCNVFRPILPFTPVVRHTSRDIEINETITILLTNVTSGLGTNVSYLVNFGDNSETIVTRKSSVNRAYGLHGLYTVNITAINEVSTFNTSINVKVHKPVLKLEGANIPALVAKFNQSVSITIFFLKGSDFNCHWEFGDGQEIKKNATEELIYFKHFHVGVESFTNVSMSAKHVFKQVGVYQATVICQNRLSEVTTMTYVTVQKEIELFQVSSVGPVAFGNSFFVNWTIASGTNVTFKVFLNQQDLDIENHDLYHMSQVTPSIYKQAGKHNITVTAKNLVTPLLSQTQIVAIEVPVSDVYINTRYLDAGKLHAGHGIDMNTFPEGVPVVFEASVNNGSSLQYIWSISETTTQIERNRPKIEYTFNTPGIYTISIRVGNQVSEAVSSVVIAVQKRASFLNGRLECSSPKVKKETVTIRATVKILGTNSTLLIELDNNTRYWYGDATVENDTTTQYGGELKRTVVIHYVYDSPGVYNITAVIRNDVSKSSANCEVEILSRPCKKPEVKLNRVGNIPKDARHLFTSEDIIIDADIDVFCPESKKSQYEWKVFQYNPERRIFVPFDDVISDGEASMQELRLKKRALPLGLFRLRLRVNMIGEDLDDFFAVAEGYIRIVRSHLIAKISGGSEIRRSFGSIVSVNGLGSYDPDVGPGNYSGICIHSWIILF